MLEGIFGAVQTDADGAVPSAPAVGAADALQRP
jgi:hypothetical protein